MVGKFREAVECCREVQTLFLAVPDDVRLLPALKSIMNIYADQGLYNDAVKMYQQIMDFQERSDLKENFQEDFNFLNDSASLFIKIEQYDAAEGILRTIIEKSGNQQRKMYFMCLNNLAVVLLNKDKTTEAKTILNEALNVANELYGKNAVHPDFARCLTNLSEVHFDLQNTEEANHLVERALRIYFCVHGEELIEPGVIDALIIKALIHQYYDRWDQMLNPLNKAKKIAEILYRDRPHPNVASVFFYLGCCEQNRANFTEAINHYQRYLKIHDDQRSELQKIGCDCRTAYVLVMIANMGAHCSYDAAYCLSCLEKALEIEEHVHGKGCNHDHLAMCFGSLGTSLITTNQESKGLEYLCKAMQMFQEINLDTCSNKMFGEQLQQIFGSALAEHCHDQSEKHLRTVQAILKKRLNDDCHVALLEINSSLLNVFLQTNRIQDGCELAKQQKRLIDTMLSRSAFPSAEQLCLVYNLARFYEKCGQWNTAKEIYIDLISRLEDQVDSTDSDKDSFLLLLCSAQICLGEIYRNDRMFINAESIFQRIIASVHKTTSQRSFVNMVSYEAQKNLAAVFMETGRYEQAHQLLDNLINIYEKDSKSIGAESTWCIFFLRGELNRRCSRVNHALQDLEKALKVAEQSRGASVVNSALPQQNKIDYARIINTIGLIYEQSGNLQRALEYYYCCINTVERLPPNMVTAAIHQNAADALRKIGKLDGALVHYKKSMEIREILHSEDPVREDIATVLYYIAVIQYTDDKPKDALETLAKLIPLRKELFKKDGFLQNYGAALVLKGNCHIVQSGEAQLAKEAYGEAEKVFEIMTNGQPNLDYVGVLNNMGNACFLLNEWQQAILKLQKAHEMKKAFYEETGEPEVALDCRLLARALLKNQEYEKALCYFKEALKYFEISQSQDDETECVLNIALCYKGLKNLDCALDNIKKVEELCVRKSVSKLMQLDIHRTIADILAENEYTDRSKLLYHLKEAETILKGIERSEDDENTLSEIQAKILSLDSE